MRSLSKLRIYLKEFSHNLELVQQLAPHKKILPMLKAQAYGHGTIPMAKHLFQNHDAKIFEGIGLATVFEAFDLRSQLKECPVPLYVFSELNLKEKKEWYEQWGLFPVMSTFDDVQFFLEEKSFRKIPLCLKFNSGMNRLGLDLAEQNKVIELLKKNGRTSVYHLMSHFAHSVVKDHPTIQMQLKQMEQVKNTFVQAGITIDNFSMANSGAIEQKLSMKDSIVRPGIMLYGPRSLPKVESPWKGKIISELQTTILDVRRLKKEETFGYALTTTPEDGFLIILPLGYADGMQFGFNHFSFLIEGVAVQFFARPNMDLCYLWSTDPKVLSWKGKKISIWGRDNENLQLLSDHNQTISYQVLTSISSRVPRDYALE